MTKTKKKFVYVLTRQVQYIIVPVPAGPPQGAVLPPPCFSLDFGAIRSELEDLIADLEPLNKLKEYFEAFQAEYDPLTKLIKEELADIKNISRADIAASAAPGTHSSSVGSGSGLTDTELINNMGTISPASANGEASTPSSNGPGSDHMECPLPGDSGLGIPELDITKNELIHGMGTDLPDAPQSDIGRQLPTDLGLGMTKNELINNMGTDLPDVLQSNAKRKLPSDLEDLGVNGNELINNMGTDFPGVPQSNVERPLPMDPGPGMTKNELTNNLGATLPDTLQSSAERQLPADSGLAVAKNELIDNIGTHPFQSNVEHLLPMDSGTGVPVARINPRLLELQRIAAQASEACLCYTCKRKFISLDDLSDHLAADACM